MQKVPDCPTFHPFPPQFLPHFPPFCFFVGTFSYIFHDVLVTISHFPPFPPMSPHCPRFPPFPPFSRWIPGYSGCGYFLGLQEAKIHKKIWLFGLAPSVGCLVRRGSPPSPLRTPAPTPFISSQCSLALPHQPPPASGVCLPGVHPFWLKPPPTAVGFVNRRHSNGNSPRSVPVRPQSVASCRRPPAHQRRCFSACGNNAASFPSGGPPSVCELDGGSGRKGCVATRSSGVRLPWTAPRQPPCLSGASRRFCLFSVQSGRQAAEALHHVISCCFNVLVRSRCPILQQHHCLLLISILSNRFARCRWGCGRGPAWRAVRTMAHLDSGVDRQSCPQPAADPPAEVDWVLRTVAFWKEDLPMIDPARTPTSWDGKPPPPFITPPPRGYYGSGMSGVHRKRTYGGRPGQRVEEQGTWAAQKHSEAGYGRPVDRGVWTAKTVKRPRQQPAQPPIRQLLGAADTQTAHPATFSTVPTHQLLGSANAETTPARAPAAVADRTQRPDATCEGKDG